MVSIAALGSATTQLVQGLGPEDARASRRRSPMPATPTDKVCSSGQNALEFALGVASTLAFLRSDAETRIAGLMFELTVLDPKAGGRAGSARRQGSDRPGDRRAPADPAARHDGRQRAAAGAARTRPSRPVAQVETLRKMLLAMASDMRVVLVRLASCVTTLRYFADLKLFNEMTHAYGRETLDLYAPLANRLGIWQLKWELEDLSFRFIEPETYKRIAKMLEEKRMMREGFVQSPSRACKRAGRGRHQGRSVRPAQAHLQHLEQDARQGARFPSCTTCARSA
jgi:GTP pyrophosphokinase